MELDEIMSEARIDGEDDIWTMASDAQTVRVVADELGDEWVITFADQYDTVQYAYIPLSVEVTDLVEWLRSQGLERNQIRVTEQ
jgi:hypothetical protein